MNAAETRPAQVRKVVIAGGGTAGWLAAAALSRQLGDLLDITLVESEEIGTVGVGEATIPPMRVFHKLLRIDEREFMRATHATFKLGIHFEHWGRKDHRYIHAFGRNGRETWLCDFHHFWLRGLEEGFESELGEYCLELQAAKACRFATSPDSTLNYAYHLDAGAYAGFLRRFSEGYGAKRREGRIERVNLDPASGYVVSLTLASGETIEGDLFIDCTGFRGLIIEQALETGYEDWSHWLPCDRALPVQTRKTGPAVPYTRSVAHDAGWRWQIPLRHRVGNGLVYCSRYLSDDEAAARLLGALDAEVLTEPRVIRFRTGRRRKAWNRNCVALGLASGFVEPLESTSIHLIMTGVTRLMQLFPFAGITRALVDRYNELTRAELESIRDFIVLHYHATERDDTPFWNHCRTMEVPDTLAQRIALFREHGHAWQADGELFRVDSWTQVMLGQGIVPAGYHHLARALPRRQLIELLENLRQSVQRTVASFPEHQAFVDRYCAEA
ncbi:MAG TPA: tryptophan halogenase family protein [Woeseiaceae bacterium]|nr:tryptophan halogenase family protein [Woeseiaceae bacterium]